LEQVNKNSKKEPKFFYSFPLLEKKMRLLFHRFSLFKHLPVEIKYFEMSLLLLEKQLLTPNNYASISKS